MKSYDSEHLMRAKVYREVSGYIRRGGKMKDLAKKAGCATATVSRLAYGETRYPRMKTVVAVLSALGFRLVLQEGAADEVATDWISPSQMRQKVGVASEKYDLRKVSVLHSIRDRRERKGR